MPLINKDLINQESNTFFQELSDALKNDDAQAAAGAMQKWQESICQTIEQEFEQYQNVTDVSVLQNRGLRVLTSEENAWYQKFIGAVKSGAKQEVTNLTAAMPVTIIDRVIEDMQREHPLLNEISIQDAAGATKLVMNGAQLASKLGSWGAVGSAIETEIKGAVKVVDVTVAKYTAYFIIPKDFVKFNFAFAPMWVDQYIRMILSESIAFGLENTIISGDGDDQFIGMIMDTTTAVEGVYSAKEAVALTDFEDSYAEVVADLAVDGNGDYRNIPEVLLVVNPVDYIKSIRKFQNLLVPGVGPTDLINNTYPTKVVTSAAVSSGYAVAGVAKNYFAAINGGRSGIIEFSDENQFLEDNRVYTTRVYGHGRPVDNTSFAYLDISGLIAPSLPVKVIGTATVAVDGVVATKEEAEAAGAGGAGGEGAGGAGGQS